MPNLAAAISSPSGRGFMIVLGATSTSTAVLSVAVLFIIGRARSGAAAAVRDLLGTTGAWSQADPPISSVL